MQLRWNNDNENKLASFVTQHYCLVWPYMRNCFTKCMSVVSIGPLCVKFIDLKALLGFKKLTGVWLLCPSSPRNESSWSPSAWFSRRPKASSQLPHHHRLACHTVCIATCSQWHSCQWRKTLTKVCKHRYPYRLLLGPGLRTQSSVALSYGPKDLRHLLFIMYIAFLV